MGLGVFALLDGRSEESRAHFRDVLDRESGRAQARLMLALIDGSLPEAERTRLCEALRTVAGGATTVDACPAGAP